MSCEEKPTTEATGDQPSEATATTPATNGTKPKRTPEEQEILDAVARGRGAEWTEANAELILNQAREFGDL